MNLSIRKYASLLATYLKFQKGRVAVLGVLMAVSLGLQLVSPQILRRFLDSATSGGDIDLVVRLGLVFFGVEMLERLMNVGSSYVGADVGWRAMNRLREDLIAHCLRLDMSFHNRMTAGEMISRINGDVGVLTNVFSQFTFVVVLNVLMMFGAVLLLAREHLIGGIFYAVYGTATLCLFYHFRQTFSDLHLENRKARADHSSFLEERLGGIDDIRSSGAIDYTQFIFGEKVKAVQNTGLAARMMSDRLMAILGVVPTLGYFLCFFVSAWYFQQGEMTIGTVVLMLQYVNMVFRPVRRLTIQVRNFQAAGGSVTRIDELVSATSEIVDVGASSQFTLPKARSDEAVVVYDDVSFRYGDGPTVLSNVSFQLASGRVLGLLGRTGSGKTTLTRLLFRLYDPSSGSISVLEQDLKDWPVSELRRTVGLVTQDVQLFAAPIRDNLAFFDPEIDDDRILAGIHEVGLTEWLAGLPDGLDTEVASGGSNLSAGQAQLLALVRVHLRDPQIVILDEASSRLDPVTERLLEGGITRLLSGRTAIIIAHRLETIQRADEVMILESGRIVEHGGREELASQEGSRLSYLLREGASEWLG
jgi:ATP-binding cassette, subfamily B, bacterial